MVSSTSFLDYFYGTGIVALALAILLTALKILCGMVRGVALLAPSVNPTHPHGLAIIIFTV